MSIFVKNNGQLLVQLNQMEEVGDAMCSFAETPILFRLK